MHELREEYDGSFIIDAPKERQREVVLGFVDRYTIDDVGQLVEESDAKAAEAPLPEDRLQTAEGSEESDEGKAP